MGDQLRHAMRSALRETIACWHNTRRVGKDNVQCRGAMQYRSEELICATAKKAISASAVQSHPNGSGDTDMSLDVCIFVGTHEMFFDAFEANLREALAWRGVEYTWRRAALSPQPIKGAEGTMRVRAR